VILSYFFTYLLYLTKEKNNNIKNLYFFAGECRVMSNVIISDKLKVVFYEE